MPASLETHTRPPSLEKHVEELERTEHLLEQRTEKLRLRNAWTLILSLLAVGIAIGALIVALATSGSEGEGTITPARGGASGSARAPATAPGTITVGLGEWYVRPEQPSVPAGKVTFVARNAGAVEHELMIERAPIRFEAPGRPTEDAALAMVEDIAPGATGRMTVRLAAGRYVLFCNLPGHYAAGQHTAFSVTRK